MDKMDKNLIQKDRMRFKPNSLSSSLAFLAIILNVVFFVSLYKVDADANNDTVVYSWLIALSIIYNLLFMLVTILCSQGVKAYNAKFSIVLLVIGAIQLVRIFILPSLCFLSETPIIEQSTYTLWVVALLASAGLLFVAGITGVLKSRVYHKYVSTLAPQLS